MDYTGAVGVSPCYSKIAPPHLWPHTSDNFLLSGTIRVYWKLVKIMSNIAKESEKFLPISSIRNREYPVQTQYDYLQLVYRMQYAHKSTSFTIN